MRPDERGLSGGRDERVARAAKCADVDDEHGVEYLVDGDEDEQGFADAQHVGVAGEHVHQRMPEEVEDQPAGGHVGSRYPEAQMRVPLGQVETPHADVPANEGRDRSADTDGRHEAHVHVGEREAVGAQRGGAEGRHDDVGENGPGENVTYELNAGRRADAQEGLLHGPAEAEIERVEGANDLRAQDVRGHHQHFDDHGDVGAPGGAGHAHGRETEVAVDEHPVAEDVHDSPAKRGNEDNHGTVEAQQELAGCGLDELEAAGETDNAEIFAPPGSPSWAHGPSPGKAVRREGRGAWSPTRTRARTTRPATGICR